MCIKSRKGAALRLLLCFWCGQEDVEHPRFARWQDALTESSRSTFFRILQRFGVDPCRGQEDLILVAATQSRENFGFATLLGQYRL